MYTIIGIITSVFVYISVTDLFIPHYYRDTWAVTSTYEGFYKVAPGELQAVFLGSSTSAASFDPKVLKDNYDISAYNLCCEQQSMLMSYYWLKEVLRSHHPQIVVLDADMLYPNYDESILNSEEAFVRAAHDPMKWTENKIDSAIEICDNDPEHELFGYFFPLYRYHDRWKNGEDLAMKIRDFSVPGKERRGYVYLDSECGNEAYQPLYPEGVDHYTEMLPKMVEYLDKIEALCAENGIYLMLVTPPTGGASYAVHNSVDTYAQEHNLIYIDFNDNRFYNACNYSFSKDNADNSHPNYKGAEKLTDFVGQMFKQVYFM